MVELAYLYFTDFQSDAAHVVQVLSTANHLSKFLGNKFQLVIPKPFGSFNPRKFFYKSYLNWTEIQPFGKLKNIDYDGFFTNIYTIFALRSLRNLSSKDIVFCRGHKNLYRILQWRSRFNLKFKVIYEAHQIFHITGNMTPQKTRNYEKRLLEETDGLITITEGLKEDIMKFAEVRKCLVLPDAVNLQNFRIAARYYENIREELLENLGINLDDTVINYTGSYSKWKGSDLLLEAFEHVRAKIDCKLLLVGNTDYVDENIEQINLKYEDSIIRTGRINNKYIPFLLWISNILVLPNIDTIHGKRYSSPLKLFEYLASGRPVLCSDFENFKIPGFESQLHYFDPDEKNSLANKLIELLPIPVNKQQASVNSKVESYSYSQRAKKIISFCKSISNSV